MIFKNKSYKLSLIVFALHEIIRSASGNFLCSSCVNVCSQAYWSDSKYRGCQNCTRLPCSSTFAQFFRDHICISKSEVTRQQFPSSAKTCRYNQNFSNAVLQTLLSTVSSRFDQFIIDFTRFYDLPQDESLQSDTIPSIRSSTGTGETAVTHLCRYTEMYRSPPTAEHNTGIIVVLHKIASRKQVFHIKFCQPSASTANLNCEVRCRTEKIMHKAYIRVTFDQYDATIFKRCQKRNSYWLCDDWVQLPGSCSAYLASG